MQIVVGAGIVRGGRVLAARRTSPPEAAGRWELPGGKVEPGESPEAALVREIAEELGCAIAVTGWLDGEAPIGSAYVLRVATARLVDGAAEPVPHEHDQVRWVGPAELDALDWLEPDRPFLQKLRHVLHADPASEHAIRDVTSRGVRGIFFDEDDARAVAASLVSDGFTAEVTRERLAGEDDDEDHPWAVVTDAPQFALELLVDRHDGWLDVDEPAPAAPLPPLDLPMAPKRIKRGQ